MPLLLPQSAAASFHDARSQAAAAPPRMNVAAAALAHGQGHARRMENCEDLKGATTILSRPALQMALVPGVDHSILANLMRSHQEALGRAKPMQLLRLNMTVPVCLDDCHKDRGQ
mmetsp:Transcript_35331/g.82538  ORF Transcript_35331/g.82538 Transcript_35331/m.82538 type:complete len:115 (-) Transcript_35331:1385-1729(-)